METYNGYKIEIEQDEINESPREWDNLGTLVTAHKRYKGDEELSSDCSDIDEAFEEHLKENGLTFDKIFYHKVYLYEHSGVSVSTEPYGDRWDSGLWGFIYISIEDAEQNFMSIKKEDLEKESLETLAKEIKTLDRYYTGEIYQYWIEVLDEYSGGYESKEKALAEAKFIIDIHDKGGKINKDAERIFGDCIDHFWNQFHKYAESLYIDKNGEQDGDKIDLLKSLIKLKLEKY